MSDTLRSILCGEEVWVWDSNNANTITFNIDGTGELVCRHELNVWIAAEFEWKPLRPELLDQRVDLSRAGPAGARPPQPQLLGQFSIELTLAPRRIARMRRPDAQHWRINEALLTDAAFRPKTFALRLEHGSFITQYDARPPGAQPHTPRFALRLAFDPSPYPPRHEWREPAGAPDAMCMWEWKEFCARPSLESETNTGKGRLGEGCALL